MELEKHIQNLKQYIKDDAVIEQDGSDFANFCKAHCEDIQAVLEELDNRIPKEKVETEIKMLDEEIEKLNSKEDGFWTDYTIILDRQKEKLQDLLNKE